MAYARTNRSPALFASALVHAGVLVCAMIAWPWFSKPMQIGKVVPVTLVTSGPPAELAPAIEAPQPQEAMAPAPLPEAPPEPAPISSAPPTPPVPDAAPKTSVAAKASQAKPTPAKPEPDFLSDLTKRLAVNTQQSSTRATSGQIGQNQQRAAAAASDQKGADDKMSASELGALIDKLGKLWNPNCQVEGAGGFVIRVHVRLTPQGFLAAPPELPDKDKIMGSGNPVLIASAQRALSAVGRGQPYTDVLKPEHFTDWHEMILKFDAKNICRG